MPKREPQEVPASWCADRVSWPVSSIVDGGLAGAAATASRVAWLDPAGRLLYRGVPLESLASHTSFEEVSYLLVSGRRADRDPSGFSSFTASWASAARVPDRTRDLLARLEPGVAPLCRLRAGASMLRETETLAGDARPAALLAELSALVVALVALEQGHPVLPPSEGETVAARITRALTSDDPTPERVAALETMLVTFADGGLQPLTFGALVVASCLASPGAALVAGLGAAAGVRAHGAAYALSEALKTLDGRNAAETWVDDHLAKGGRVPGFGHRIFGARDPRVAILRETSTALVEGGAASVPPHDAERMLETTRVIEAHGRARLRDRDVGPNASLHGALLVSLLCATSRIAPLVTTFASCAGTLARANEYHGQNRIFRPLDRYVGPDPRPYVELGAR